MFLSSEYYSAWEIESLESLGEGKRVEVVSPASYSGVFDLPEEVFAWGQFRKRYFSNLQIDFGARVLDANRFELWFVIGTVNKSETGVR